MQKLNFKTKQNLYYAIIITLTIQLSSCAMIFVPGKQKVQINPNNDSTAIYINNEEHGVGQTTTKVKTDWFLDVSLKTDGYLTQHEVITPRKYKHWAIPLCIIDIPIYGVGISEMTTMAKMRSFDKVNEIELLPRLVTRTPNDKYIEIQSVKFKSTDSKKDLLYHWDEFNIKKSIDENIKRVDEEYVKNKVKSEKQEAKNKKAAKKRLNADDKTVNMEDMQYSRAIYKTLTETGFIDTVNQVFLDQNNTILIEGVVTKKVYYRYYSKSLTTLDKCKINTTWYLKNTFGEKIDSASLWSNSGSFVASNKYLMYDDVINRSLQDFLKSDVFKQYSKIDTNFNIQDAPLSINKPKNIVAEANDATIASVIIKRKDKGHGSGFAISNDGYVLTNYHVIAGEYANKQAEFTVILSNGEEVKAQVVRFNKMRDVALLKVDATFEKAFDLRREKTFKRLMNVYTVGTPKSIELGQSVSLGILSNERNTNNRNLLQLNMSVNSGNSGGPLFDQQGVLHGIVTSKLVGANTEGVSFAIPSYLVADYLNIK